MKENNVTEQLDKVSFDIPRTLKKNVKMIAKQNGRSMSSEIRMALEEKYGCSQIEKQGLEPIEKRNKYIPDLD